MKTLAEWLQYLEQLHPQAIALGLDRVAAVRDAMGLAPRFPVVTVGGTNGKGSTCAYLEAMLRHAGYRTGLYTSPHLVRYNERVRVAGDEVADAELAAAFERVEAARGDTRLTYFEFGTLAAMALFIERGVEACVLEVGLGGRLDAVNAFDPDCAVVVSVALDHMDYLGDTREAIGFEKAGIFRAGRPAVCADPDPPGSLVAHARAIGARLLRLGEDFSVDADRVEWRYRGPSGVRSGLPLPSLRGGHQVGNAAAAIAALDTLRDRLPIDMQAVRMGLATASVAGRFQVLPGRPVTVLDVAHNPHAARTLAATLVEQGRFGRTFAVFAMLADKDAAGVVREVAPRIDRWHVAGTHGPRGMGAASAAAIVEAADPGVPIAVFDDVVRAYRDARERAGEGDRIVVFGSFHTVADVLAEQSRPRGAR